MDGAGGEGEGFSLQAGVWWKGKAKSSSAPAVAGAEQTHLITGILRSVRWSVISKCSIIEIAYGWLPKALAAFVLRRLFFIISSFILYFCPLGKHFHDLPSCLISLSFRQTSGQGVFPFISPCRHVFLIKSFGFQPPMCLLDINVYLKLYLQRKTLMRFCAFLFFNHEIDVIFAMHMLLMLHFGSPFFSPFEWVQSAVENLYWILLSSFIRNTGSGWPKGK